MAIVARFRTSAIFVLTGLAIIALSACELALHQVEKSQRDCSRAWQAGCDLTVDISSDRPIEPTSSSVDPAAVIENAETAPHRTCDAFPIGCQATEIGDVIVDRYVSVF